MAVGCMRLAEGSLGEEGGEVWGRGAELTGLAALAFHERFEGVEGGLAELESRSACHGSKPLHCRWLFLRLTG